MLRHAVLQCSRSLYQQEIRDKIVDLEHLDFEPKATQDFRAAVILSGNQLVRNGQSSYLKAKTKGSFLSQEITLDVDSASQEWELRLMTRIKTIGVNTRALVILTSEP